MEAVKANKEDYGSFLTQLKAIRDELSQQNIGNDSSKNEQGTNELAPKVFSIGTVPGAGNLMCEEKKQNQKGFTGPFMLGLLTFLFETLFLMVSFLIFK